MYNYNVQLYTAYLLSFMQYTQYIMYNVQNFNFSL